MVKKNFISVFFSFLIVFMGRVSLFAMGIPIIGKLTGVDSAKKGVKRTLANVDDVVKYIRIFLIAVSIIIFILLLMWIFRLFVTKARRKRLHEIIAILHRIQSDLILLKESDLIQENQIFEVRSSLRDSFLNLRDRIEDKFFQIRLGAHAYHRMHNALDLIFEGKMSIQNQISLVAQWLKTVDVLCR